MNWLMGLGLAVAIAVLLRGAISRSATKKPKFLALCEYWVYIEGDQIPDQKKLMDRMISANPHNRRGRPSIGAREGMLFSDIRLTVGLAKKTKNPLVFRPDLFQSDLEVDQRVFERLVRAQSLIKVRYCSEVPLTDNRHLQFMPHMADAYSDLTQGLLVYDVLCERILLAEEFTEALSKENNVEKAESHVRVVWTEKVEEGVASASTKGLRKIGFPDLKTNAVVNDQRTLVTSLVEDVAKRVFETGAIEGTFETEGFGDTFQIELGAIDEGAVTLSIRRIARTD